MSDVNKPLFFPAGVRPFKSHVELAPLDDQPVVFSRSEADNSIEHFTLQNCIVRLDVPSAFSLTHLDDVSEYVENAFDQSWTRIRNTNQFKAFLNQCLDDLRTQVRKAVI